MELRIEGAALKVLDAVPAGHKVALVADPARRNRAPLRASDRTAKRLIEPGQHIHTQTWLSKSCI